MSVFDFLKKEKPKKEEKEVKKLSKVKLEKKPTVFKQSKEEKKKPKTKISNTAYRILKSPHITEKATDLTKKNQYIFKIWPKANKIEVRKAVEEVFGVDVVSVRIIKIPRKRRRMGKILGWRKGYKKAIVKIKKGQKIEVLPR